MGAAAKKSRAALEVCAMNEQRLREAFNLFDKDKDGLISTDELQTVMRSLAINPTTQDVRELIGEGVSGQFTARGGNINFDLFCQLMGKEVKAAKNEDELKDAFRVLDKDGQGFISISEMQAICKSLGEDMERDEVDAMIKEAISNYDGRIFYDGFVKTMIS